MILIDFDFDKHVNQSELLVNPKERKSMIEI